MEEIKEIICTLIIPKKIYMELTEEIREIFVEKEGLYSTQFPADAEENTFLGEYIQAFCEEVLIKYNPKYEITDDCTISSELLKLGPSERAYSLLISIQYPGSNQEHHDILYFQEVSQSLGYYTFEMLGDQTLFSTE